ncbi:MAG: L-seryl-tRNA(Sec) selenium transferase [Pyrinomonadaceae bacterium]
MNDSVENISAMLRNLPSIDEILAAESVKNIRNKIGGPRLAALARTAVESLRIEIQGRQWPAENGNDYSRPGLLEAAIGRLKIILADEQALRVRRVINATGVIIHTNLGRAPLSYDAKDSLLREASNYCTLEYNTKTGKRGKRGAYAENILAEITGAESALIVNNCAAAAFLILTVFANGGEVIVSRGELVEIGGDFRVPDVLTQSGAVLKEVGTTNRTKLRDYENAIGEKTSMILRVHPSNYKIVGFTERPKIGDLADLAIRNGILLYEDAGSGAIFDLAKYGLDDEPVISHSIAAGADIVSFSGDKLLGGPQSGLIVGRADLIDQIRRHPLYRALRVDKLAYAVLEATLNAFRRDTAFEDIPVLKMLSASSDELAERANSFAEKARKTPGSSELQIEIVSGNSVVGGGSAPSVKLETTLLMLSHPKLSAGELEYRLRSAETPVIIRIADEKVMIDLRTVFENEESELLEALKKIA